MGQPVTKTAIGRAWVRHQGMGEATADGKNHPGDPPIPEPALALPVYDNNGKSADWRWSPWFPARRAD
ncbi:conjugal transfer nickase/helicase TraI [Citrobacter amalonaticus]|nr:conjugal transfer nickase/helicase TraI [Citrobacter amalonaticus]